MVAKKNKKIFYKSQEDQYYRSISLSLYPIDARYLLSARIGFSSIVWHDPVGSKQQVHPSLTDSHGEAVPDEANLHALPCYTAYSSDVYIERSKNRA